MTLVVVISRNFFPTIMFADILLSQDNKAALTAIPFPTQPRKPVVSNHVIVGLTQKIVKIADGLMLGFAGDTGSVPGLIDFLLREYYLYKTIEGVMIAFKTICKANCERYQNLQAVLVAQLAGQSRTAAFNCKEFYNEHLGTIVALGSGAEQFETYVAKMPPVSGMKVGNPIAPSDADRICYTLHYVTSTLKHQASTGYGVAEAWGGGFELAMMKNDKFTEKLDDVFTHAYSFSASNRKVSNITGIERRIFQFYSGSNFVVVTQPGNGKTATFVIPPLTEEKGAQQSSLSQRFAKLVYLYFVDAETGRLYVYAEYNEAGSPNFRLCHKPGVGAYIDVCMSYVKKKLSRPKFSMTRYFRDLPRLAQRVGISAFYHL